MGTWLSERFALPATACSYARETSPVLDIISHNVVFPALRPVLLRIPVEAAHMTRPLTFESAPYNEHVTWGCMGSARWKCHLGPICPIVHSRRGSPEMAIFFASVRILAICSSPCEYFVSPDGSDAGPGASGKPFRTMQKAADVVEAGDTCLVGGGTYREAVRVRNSGTGAAPIRPAAYPGEAVTFSGTGVIQGNGTGTRDRHERERVWRSF